MGASRLPSWEQDLERWLEPFLAGLRREEQRRWAPVYLKGLLLPGERKSVEPIAARVAPGEVQQLHPFISTSPWAAAPLEQELGRQAERLVGGRGSVLVVDDTALVKQGKRSAGVLRQYCGQLGKRANCQVLVSLTLAKGEVPICVGLRLVLPNAWVADAERRAKAGVPEGIEGRSKGQVALEEIDRLIAGGVTFDCVLGDAECGKAAAFRQGLSGRRLIWALGIAPNQKVYPADVTLIQPGGRDRRRGGSPGDARPAPLRRGRRYPFGGDAGRAVENRGGAGAMSARTAYPLKISASLKRAAERLASEDGVSLNHWINMAVAQKIGAVETAEHFRRRYGEARHGDLRAVFDKRPDVPPEPGDELPAELAARFGRA